jgi:hypothetical protein
VGDDEVLHGVGAAREAAQPIALVVGLSAQQDRPVFLTDSATASPPAGEKNKSWSPPSSPLGPATNRSNETLMSSRPLLTGASLPLVSVYSAASGAGASRKTRAMGSSHPVRSRTPLPGGIK